MIKPTKRHGKDGLLKCTILPDTTIANLIDEQFLSVIQKIQELSETIQSNEFIGFKTWSEQPWNPFLLEWLVEFFPVESLPNLGKGYAANFLKDKYILAEQAFDLSPKSAYRTTVSSAAEANHIPTAKDFNTYSGSSILTPYAASLLEERITNYLKPYTQEENNSSKNAVADNITNPVYKVITECRERWEKNQARDRQLEAYIRARIPHNYPRYTEATKIDANDFFGKLENIQDVEKWYKKQNLQTIPNLLHTFKKAQDNLGKINCLSQALGGFNAALLMHKQTLQLKINDPIGFQDYYRFTQEVQEAVAHSTTVAPQPLDRFNPIRAGEMRLINLQLIDTFGQVKILDWDRDQVIVPETMKSKEKQRVFLHPRLVQPARINFQWLPAEDNKPNQTESKSKSNFTSICGWIVPNNLNNSLLIYSTSGQALGSIETSGKWIYAPGPNLVEVNQIPNPHLQKVIQKILDLNKLGTDFIKQFVNVLNNALENIQLGQLTQSNLLSLLVGRPIAVVRASVNLQLEGLAAINQNWQIFQQDMLENRSIEKTCSQRRETNGFTNVEFPIRIGEYQQFNDGVIGYWKEQENGQYEGDIFYAQQSDAVESQYIETQYWDTTNNQPGIEEGPINIIQTLDSPPQQLTMLIDPSCAVHISAGILPTKVVTIASEEYVPILEKLEVPFLTSPILTHRREYNLSLPKVPQYAWSWLEKTGEEWHKIYDFPTINKSTLQQYNPKPVSDSEIESIWQKLITEGWLKTIPNDSSNAAIVPKENRPKKNIDLSDQDKKIDQFLNIHQLSLMSASSQVSFAETQQIREGWLLLKKVKDQ